MLVLTRRVDERIIIETASGEQIVVSVVSINGSQAKLGVVADPDTTIDREEIYIDKKKQD